MVLNVCIIGAGRIAKSHIKNILGNLNYNLVCILDIIELKAKNLARTNNCDYSTNFEYLIENNDKIDAVFITTTTNTHHYLTKMCLGFNLHVFCEKPIGQNYKEISECFDLAKKNNLKLFIGYQKRYDDDYRKMYELLEDKITNFKIQNIKMTTKDNPIPPSQYLKTSNGIVEDMLSHDVDIINLFMNFETPKQLVAFQYTHLKELKNINEIEGIEVMIQYENGRIATINGSRNASSYGYDQRMEIFGDFGLYQLENKKDNDIKIFNSKNIILGSINDSFPERYSKAYLNEINYFYDMIKNDKKSRILKEHILLNKKICKAINLSIEENRIVGL